MPVAGLYKLQILPLLLLILYKRNHLGKPTMAFKGIRISWLILTKESVCIRSDSSTLHLASISSLERRTRSLISWVTFLYRLYGTMSVSNPRRKHQHICEPHSSVRHKDNYFADRGISNSLIWPLSIQAILSTPGWDAVVQSVWNIYQWSLFHWWTYVMQWQKFYGWLPPVFYLLFLLDGYLHIVELEKK